ncbi:MAG: urease accessory protein UreF [Gammaproteobacteria bacterium]|nr:MAG: urease accessory protein UreF [Gammaproteobacteria bacterium]
MKTEEDLHNWLTDLIRTNLYYVEIPLLIRMFQACQQQDKTTLSYWVNILIACRETSELRLEEKNRGRAMVRVLQSLELDLAESWQDVLAKSQTAGFALAMHQWTIPIELGTQAFAWSWLENMVISGVKLIPLGQMAGQRILRDLAADLAFAAQQGLLLKDEDIGSSSPALAHASACHEIQYTRLFRS